MKLKKKHIFIKFILVLIFMTFICFKTINFLYSKVSINTSDYLDIILNDTFTHDDIFINKFIKVITNDFDPIKILHIPKTNSNNSSDEYDYNKLKDTSKIIDINNSIVNPIVYIYNTHQLENYKSDIYNYVPNVMLVSFILGNKLNDLNVPTIVENEEIGESNYYNKSRELIIKRKKEYSSIIYFIDIHRDNIDNTSTIKINDKKYGKILFIIGLGNENYKYNLDLSFRLSSKLNELYPNISKGVITKTGNDVDGIYNQDISNNVMLIEIGSASNNIDEVLNTIDAFSATFKKFVEDKYE